MAQNEGEKETLHESPVQEEKLSTPAERPATPPAGPAQNITRDHDDNLATFDHSLRISAPPSFVSSSSITTTPSMNSQHSMLNDAASETDDGTITGVSNDAFAPHPLSPAPARSNSQKVPCPTSESESRRASTLPTQTQSALPPQDPLATTSQLPSSSSPAPAPPAPPSSSHSPIPPSPLPLPPAIIQQPPVPPAPPNPQAPPTYQNINASSEKRHDDGSECSTNEKKRCCGGFNRAKWIGTISCTLAPCSCYSQGSGVLGNVACCLVWPVTTVAGLVWGVANCVTYSCCGLCG